MPQAYSSVMPIPVIAIFDIGKTNKKLLLFDESYQVVFEKSCALAETTDEDGDPCENIDSLTKFIYDSMHEVLQSEDYTLKAVNFSAYGASFVLLDEHGNPVCALYNYLKPFPAKLQNQFYAAYGGEELFSRQAASPVLGSLNSGMQLYRIKYEKPELFNRIKCALHLPQYLSYLISGQAYTEITSIGCHTNLWNFQTQRYHDWVSKEDLSKIFPPLVSSVHVISCRYENETLKVGVGLHDSSAALIPYLKNFNEPFALISTGTWCITLNPFNHSSLTQQELQNDCLCYLNYQGQPVKASRLFLGHAHDEQVNRIAFHFHKSKMHYESIPFRADLIPQLQDRLISTTGAVFPSACAFAHRDLSTFVDEEEAYHQLMYDLVCQQFQSTQLVMKDSPVKRIFIDGGFSRNTIFMNLMAIFFSDVEVLAASMSQGSALGSALATHHEWNTRPEPINLIQLKHYPKHQAVA